MVVQQTSLMAWEELNNGSELGKQQLEVLNCLRRSVCSIGLTDRMIVQRTGLPINCVTPRRGELVKKGFVEESEKALCPIGQKMSIFWRVIK